MILKNKTFDNGTLRLNYVEGPESGPALLLLHGITQRWQEFMQLIPTLTQCYHVYALDFRGHGASEHVPEGYRGEDYGRDTMEFIQQRIGEPVIIFGHSLGGMVGLYVACGQPHMVNALALGDIAIFSRGLGNTMYPGMFAACYQMLREGKTFEELRKAIPEMQLSSPLIGRNVPMKLLPGCDEAYLTAWARSLSCVDPDVLFMALDGRASENWQPEEFLSHVKCPTLLMQADPALGGLMSDDDVCHAREILPDVQHVKLEGVGHSLHMAQTEPILRVLTNFLASLK